MFASNGRTLQVDSLAILDLLVARTGVCRFGKWTVHLRDAPGGYAVEVNGLPMPGTHPDRQSAGRAAQGEIARQLEAARRPPIAVDSVNPRTQKRQQNRDAYLIRNAR